MGRNQNYVWYMDRTNSGPPHHCCCLIDILPHNRMDTRHQNYPPILSVKGLDSYNFIIRTPDEMRQAGWTLVNKEGVNFVERY